MKKIFAFILTLILCLTVLPACGEKGFDKIDLENLEQINYYGRVKTDKTEGTLFVNPASGFEFSFSGTEVSAVFSSGYENNKIRVYVDNDKEGEVIYTEEETKLCYNLSDGKHTVKVLKCTELGYTITLKEIKGAKKYFAPSEKPQLKFLFYGDSITAGYGILGGELYSYNNSDATLTYAKLLADYYNADFSVIAMSGITANLPNGDGGVYAWLKNQTYFGTNEEKYKSLTWNDDDYKPDIVFINLGTNDEGHLLYSATPNVTKQQFIDGNVEIFKMLREKYKTAKIVWVYGMMDIRDTVVQGISQAITSYQKEMEDAIYYCLFDERVSCKGVNGHPDVLGNEDARDFVIKFISRKGLLK